MSVLMVYKKGIIDAESLWKETLSDARTLGNELSEGEILSALESVGCSKQSIMVEPINEYQEKINRVKTMNDKFGQLTKEIRSKIQTLVQRDKELATQLKGMVS